MNLHNFTVVIKINVFIIKNYEHNVDTTWPSLACEQGEGRGGERKRKRRDQYFDCSSFIISAGPSINYSNVCNNNNKIYVSCVAQVETCLKLEFLIHCGCMKLGNWYLLQGSFLFSYK